MEDIKFKRAFVIFGVKSPYGEAARILADYLLKYTTYDVVLYYGKCYLEPSASPRLKMVNLESLNLGFDITKFPNPLNPTIIKLALEEYDEVVYLDSDIQVTPNINNIFKESSKLTNYPIACRYPWEYMLFPGGIDWVGEDIKNGIKFENRCTPTLQVCCTLSNKNCIPFLKEWINNTINITMASPSPGYNHEEGVFNALMWNKQNTYYLPHHFIWCYGPSMIPHAIDIWDNPTTFTPFYITNNSFSDDLYYIPTKESIQDMSFVPSKKEDLWGLHGIKPLYNIKQAFNYIDKHF